jgi:ubiquinone/menaquinone biosynthesis C-methylase UbiE
MQAKLQKRIQRYGWDLAARDYESLWQKQLAVVQRHLLASICLAPDERVLDVACGTGLVSLAAARTVGSNGRVLGIDLSGHMVDAEVASEVCPLFFRLGKQDALAQLCADA